MPQMHKLSSYCTTIAADGEDTIITYHSTVIVRFNSERIILNTGGWDTATTRRKMTQAARQFELPYLVYRKEGVTYVSGKGVGDKARLVDGMEIAR